MENNQNTSELVDPKVYKKANKRVHFKIHLAIYVLVVAVMWILYVFLFRATQPEATPDAVNSGMTFEKFTIFVTLLWTVIVIFHGLFVYKFNSSMLEKEIKSLQKEIKEKEALKRSMEEQKNR